MALRELTARLSDDPALSASLGKKHADLAVAEAAQPMVLAAIAGFGDRRPIVVVTATTNLIESLLAEDHELLTLIAGDDATEAGTSLIEAWLEDHHPDIDIEVHQGEQPLYHYYLGIE